MPGLVPQVIIGSISPASTWISRSKAAPSSLGSARQRARAASQAAPFGAKGRPARYSKLLSSGATRPARAPASIDMLQTVIRSSIDSARIALPRYSSAWPLAPAVPMRAIRARIRSLALTPGASRAREGCRVRPRPALQQALRREHVADLARADAEGQRTEGAVRAGVAVAADDRRARVRESQLRADHVHDALTLVAHRVQRHAELPAVALERRDLLGGGAARRRTPPVGAAPRRDRVVHRRHGALGAPHREAARAQLREGLRRGHLVDQVQIDVEDCRRLLPSPPTRGGRPRSCR